MVFGLKVSPGRLLRNWWTSVLDLVFPKFCVGCGAAGSFACDGCLLGVKLLNDRLRVKEMSFDELIVAMEYGGFVRKIIVQFKYRFSEELSEVLGDILRSRIGEIKKEVLIVPVPLHKSRLRYRGFNQAEVLAGQLGRVNDCLVRVRSTGAQAKLGRTDRMNNLIGAFALRDGVAVGGREILLVDDVATTCSTLNECSKVLKAAGAGRICAIVLARGK